MKSQDILYSKWNNDEMYTPRYAVEPILKYIQNIVDWRIINWKIYRKPII